MLKEIFKTKEVTTINETAISIIRPIYDESDNSSIIGYIYLDRDLKDYDIRFSKSLLVIPKISKSAACALVC